MQKTQRIVLEIVYDDDTAAPPSNWDWALLLDTPDPNDVRVIASDQSHAGRPGMWQVTKETP